MLIRKIQEKDLDQIAQIEADNFSVPWKREDFARYLDADTACFLAAVESQPVPAAQLQPVPAAQSQPGPAAQPQPVQEAQPQPVQEAQPQPVQELQPQPGLAPQPQPEQMERMLAEQSEETPRITGYIGCLFATDEGDITNVSVRRDCRARGTGAALVRKLIEEAIARGCCRIFLEVRASNETAIRLYRRAGFEQVGVRKQYYKDPAEDALLMRAELNR